MTGPGKYLGANATPTPLSLAELTKPSIAAWFAFAALGINQACEQYLLPAPGKSGLRNEDHIFSRKVVRTTDAVLAGVGFEMTITETSDGIDFELLGMHKRITSVKWRLVRDSFVETTRYEGWILLAPSSKSCICASPTVVASAIDCAPHVLTGFRPSDELLIAKCLSAYRQDFDTARRTAHDRARAAHTIGDKPTELRFVEYIDEIDKRSAQFEKKRATWKAGEDAATVIARAADHSRGGV